MKTRMWKLFALVLVVALALTGCNLIAIDPDKDNAEVVASINGENITKGEVKDTYEYYLSYYTYIYEYYYGISDISDLEDDIKDSVLEAFIQSSLIAQKAAELGLDQLSDEDNATIAANAAETFESYIEEHSEDVDTEGMTDEEAREAVIAHLAEEGVTLEVITESEQESFIANLVRESVIADVVVEDSDIEEAYNEYVASNESSFSSSSYLYEMYTSNGTTIYWHPEGYRTVKHILLKATDDQKTELSTLKSDLSSIESDIAALDEADETADDADTADTDTDTESEEPVKTREELEAEKAELEAQIAEKEQEILSSLQDKIDAVQAALESGEDFDSVMAEYGEDPGMQSEPGLSNGYCVSENSTYWEDIFTKTAMSLEKVGDISEPVVGSNGVHIIYYNSDVESGATPLDDVRDELSEELLAEKQDEAYDEAYQSWYDAATVKKYPNRLDD